MYIMEEEGVGGTGGLTGCGGLREPEPTTASRRNGSLMDFTLSDWEFSVPACSKRRSRGNECE